MLSFAGFSRFADLGPAVAGPADAGIFLVAVALQRQPYLSVDNLRPTGGEVLGLGGGGSGLLDQLGRDGEMRGIKDRRSRR